MLKITTSKDASKQRRKGEKAMAIEMIVEALFPEPYDPDWPEEKE